jgi:hypothetical protein
MFSPLNDPQVDQWFQRFNAPLRRLPAAERAELHQEVRQHLDALAAANEELGSTPEEAWELALMQFGDPAQIGRKMYQEWQQSRVAHSGGAAVGFGVLLHLSWTAAMLAALQCCGPSFFAWPNSLLSFVSLLLINGVVGWKYPYQALKGALYANLFSAFVNFLCLLPKMLHPHTEYFGGVGMTVSLSASSILIGVPYSALRACSVAYLASVCKRRQWYLPRLADFTLRLPHKQRKLSR